MFYKEFLRFRKEDITSLYVLLPLPDKILLDNCSTMSRQEVFMRGLYVLCTDAKLTIVIWTSRKRTMQGIKLLYQSYKQQFPSFSHG